MASAAGGRSWVFISYASQDGGTHATRLDGELRGQDVATWLEARDMDESFDFTAQLELAIEAATAVVACITPDVRRRDSYVRREIAYAQACGKRIAVARFAAIRPPISVVTNTYFEFYRDWTPAFGRLLTFCRAVDVALSTQLGG